MFGDDHRLVLDANDGRQVDPPASRWRTAIGTFLLGTKPGGDRGVILLLAGLTAAAFLGGRLLRRG
jgi:hypothetical protein